MRVQDSQPDEERGGIGALLLGVGILLGVLVVSTLLFVPRLVLSWFRRAPERPEGYGEQPLAAPPDAAAVALRARALTLLLRRLGDPVPTHVLVAAGGDLDDAARADHEARRAMLEREVAAALADASLDAALTDDERAFLTKRAERFTHDHIMNVSWRAEALAVLLWAQGRLEVLPPYDTQVDPAMLLDLVRAPHDGVPALRPHAEIERQQSIAKLWHWRSRTRQLEEDGTPLPEQLPLSTYEELVRVTVEAAQAEGSLDAVRDGDFKAMGKSFRWLTDDEWSSVRSIIHERHHALNWLCGYAPRNDWANVPTHT